jgi:membrane peptidoglycan carboxypeptidase
MRGLLTRIEALADDFEVRHGAHASLLFDVLVLAEDRRARWHLGVDPISLFRALLAALKTGQLNGVSTIEQQLIRTLRPRQRSAWRSKPLELLLSTWIALRLPKRTIWAAYLNSAYFGADWDTLQQALDEITTVPGVMSLDDACVLVAHLKYPAPDGDWPEGVIAHSRRARRLAANCRNLPRFARYLSSEFAP